MMAINLSKTKKYEGNIDISLNNVNIINQVLVIVPCYNEAQNIVKAISKANTINFFMVLSVYLLIFCCKDNLFHNISALLSAFL